MSFPRVPGDTHAQTWDEETREPMSLASWRCFYRNAEAILGHSLDGDKLQGFSLDEAHDYWIQGWTGDDYARIVRSRANYNPD